jgi:hypothetical protein
MSNSVWSGAALALLLGIGLAACNSSEENAAVPPVDEPAATGSLPADPADPTTTETVPVTPPAEEGAPAEDDVQ